MATARPLDPQPAAVSRLPFLDGFRGVAICMVVATHAIAYAQVDPALAQTLAFWVQTIAVPPFFLADGFLFVQGMRKLPQPSALEYAARSARRLLIPWLCFSLLYLGFRAAYEYLGRPPTTVVLGHSVVDMAAAIYFSTLSAQMYFLPALFLIRACSGATKILASLHPLLLVGLWLGYAAAWDLRQTYAPAGGESEGVDPIVSALWGGQYYLLGLVLARMHEVVEARPFIWAAVSGLCFLAVELFSPGSILWAQYAYLLLLYFLSVGVGERAGPFVALGGLTMGIYLIHAPIILKVLSVVTTKLMPHPGLARYLLLTATALAASIALVSLAGKTAWWPRLLGERASSRPAR